MMAAAKRPLFYTGGGVINSGRAASELLRELVKLTGFPITSTLMGLGAFPAADPAMARHARHARHLGGQLVDARLRRDDRGRRALRRPHHRPARRLLARLEEDPHRHRSVLDQQERQGRSRHRRRLRARARGHGAAVARQRGRAGQEGARGLVGADRQMAGEEFARLSATRTRSSSRNTRSSGSTS